MPRALVGADDVGDVHAKGAQRVHRGVADGVGGNGGDVVGVHAVVGQRNGHVGLRAAVHCVKAVRLLEALIPLRGQAEHDFTEGYDFRH